MSGKRFDQAIEVLRRKQSAMRAEGRQCRELRRALGESGAEALTAETVGIDHMASKDRELEDAIKLLERENK